MKKDEVSADEMQRGRQEAAARLAAMPDIPDDFDDMSTEDWTALNEWLVKTSKSSDSVDSAPLQPKSGL